MSNTNWGGGGGRRISPMSRAVSWLAYSVAAIVTFFLMPIFHAGTIDGILNFTADRYGYFWLPIVGALWWGVCGLGVFFATVSVLLTVIPITQMKLFR